MTNESIPSATRRRRVVVVTGASAGVGRATARAFAREGAAVALLARGVDGLRAAAREVEELGGMALELPTDVADAAAVESAAARAEEVLGPIDVWVNNAMTTVFAPFHTMNADEYRRATEVTYLGTVYGTMAALARMRTRDAGVIVQVGSALAYRAIPLQAPYCGAKHAIRGFTDSLRSELLHEDSGIRLTMVQLPAMNTPQFDWCRTRLPEHPQPVPPIFQPELAAEAIVWATHHHRREIHLARSSVATIWLNKLFPGLGDRYLAKQGFEGQQSAELPFDPDRPSNLYDPVPGDAGAHGSFDDRATGRSWQWWLTRHRAVLGLATAALAIVLVVWTWS